MLVQASYPNPKGLVRPGQFAKVKIHMRTEENALLIPTRAIIAIQGKTNVFVLGEDNVVQLKEVTFTAKYGDLSLVSEGLEPKDQIVIEGIQKIRSGMSVNAELIHFESKSDNSF